MTTSTSAIHAIVEKVRLSQYNTRERLNARFMEAVGDLFSLVSDLNEYMFSTQGAHIVMPLILAGAKTFIAAIPPAKSDEIVTIFAERALPHTQKILEKDVSHFVRIAPDIFPEIPPSILTNIVGVLESEGVPPETIEDVFGFILLLVKLAIRRACLDTEKDPDNAPQSLTDAMRLVQA